MSKNKAVKLRDVIFLCHPKRTELTDKTINGTLKIADTWEVKLSEGGDKKKSWEEMIDSGKMGYMALLRNLRNILDSCDNAHIDKVIKRIESEKEVLKSKQLPFRFWSAYKELTSNNNPKVSRVLEALDKACGYSAKNLKVEGTSMIVSDVSGSMEMDRLTSKSNLRPIDIGLVMLGIAKKISPDSITGIFGSKFKIKNYPTNSVFYPILNYNEGEVGYATHGYLAIEHLLKNEIKVDNIMIFTDEQMYGGDINKLFTSYRNLINPDVKLYVFNLAGYASVSFSNSKNVFMIGGWSDKVFDIIESVTSADTMVKKIKEYK